MGVLVIATISRLFLILLGTLMDKTHLKYTDIDYEVFTDASTFVLQGLSPYQRSTYRYTPLLAYIMLPNNYIKIFGKLVFVGCDILVGILLQHLLKRYQYSHKYSYIWLLNPFVAVISTRGNAESLISLLVIATLYLLEKKWYFFGAIVYGLSVHFKIYPIIYALPIWFYIDRRITTRFQLLTYRRFMFGLVSFLTFAMLNVVMYRLYGQEFLYETYLYHFDRSDHRHNFSLYFYSMYLHSKPLLSFIPQLVVVAGVGIRFYDDLKVAMFLQTFMFVVMNKVMTSQYFLWYLVFLPLVIPGIKDKSMGGIVIGLWCLGQALWLFFAYQLEFQGQNTFLELWVSGVLFFVIQVGVACWFIRNKVT